MTVGHALRHHPSTCYRSQGKGIHEPTKGAAGKHERSKEPSSKTDLVLGLFTHLRGKHHRYKTREKQHQEKVTCHALGPYFRPSETS